MEGFFVLSFVCNFISLMIFADMCLVLASHYGNG